MSLNDRKTILIIDDEEKIRKILSIHLTKEDYNIIQSPGGAGVFNEIKRKSFELVICDIRMPEVDGVQILKYIKENYDDIPVLILTGLHDMDTAINVMKIGAVDFLIKPIAKNQLIKSVQNALRLRDLLIRNKQLETENKEYQRSLEGKVKERTSQLSEKTIELGEAYKTLQSMNLQMVTVLAEAIEAKDKYTRGHCERMRTTCLKIGERLNISDKEKIALEYAAILHDLGKIGISDSVLNKRGKLNEEETLIIREHPLIGERILSGIGTLKDVNIAIKHHHENYDGSGYPDGLKENEIPLLSRIISVADVFDALTSKRPYREPLPLEEAFAELDKLRGTKLDKEIVDLLRTEKRILGIDAVCEKTDINN